MGRLLTSRMIAAALGLTLATAAGLPAAAVPKPASQVPRKGDAEFRAAWVAFAAPAADPEKSRSLEARQQACMAAIPGIEAAVAADPGDPLYLESLAYVCLSAAQNQKGKEAVDKAIAVKRDRPLLYMLRGQAEAVLAQMDPPKAGERIGPSLAAFDRAAHLDPMNSLPLFQGASVAFDVNRPDLALPRVKQALERPGATLYRLAVPEDLGPDKGTSLRTWQYVQLGQWFEVLARCRNVGKSLLSLASKAEAGGDLATAEQRSLQALQVGRQVGEMQPHMFITVWTAQDMMADAYDNLVRLGEERLGMFGAFYRVLAILLGMGHAYTDLARLGQWANAPDLARWHGEAGVIQFARGELAGALKAFLKEVTKNTEPTVDWALEMEAKSVAPVIAGMGLNPHTGELKPASKPEAGPAPLPPGSAGQRPAPAAGPRVQGRQ